MTIDAWPSDLPTGVVCFYPVGGGRSAGGAFMSPPAAGASTYGPRWTARVEQLPLLRRETLLAARALQARLESGAKPVMLEACPHQLAPQVQGGATIETVAGADATAGDDQVQVLLAGDFLPLRGGELFSADHDDENVGRRMYLVVELIDNADPAAPTVRIVPNLRGDIAADAVLDFLTPSCPMHLVDGFDLPTEHGRFSQVDPAMFEEWFDASPIRQVANLRDLTLSPATIEEASPEDTFVGRLFGMTSGSTVTLTDDAGGRFKLVDDAGTLKIYAGATATDFGTATSHDIVVTETLLGRANSPHDTTLTIAVTEIVVTGPAPHRAWRWFNFSSNKVGFTGLTSIAFYDGAGDEIVGGWTPVSGGSGTDGVGQEAAKAFDGNPATFWVRSSQTNCWLGGDRGATEADWVSVSDIGAVAAGTDAAAFEYGSYTAGGEWTDDDPSDPGAVWTSFVTRTFGNTWLLSNERLLSETDPSDGSYRCLRYVVLSTWGSTVFVQTSEIEMRIAGVNILPAGHDNDSLIRGIASADNSGTHRASHTWDGNLATVWLPGVFTTVGNWFGAVFPDPVNPGTFHLRQDGGSYNIKLARIDGSHDGVTWTTIGSTGVIPNGAGLYQIYP